MKRFLDDPARTIEPHEFGDFRKELLQVLQEVKQEISNRENIDPIEEEEKPSMVFFQMGGKFRLYKDKFKEILGKFWKFYGFFFWKFERVPYP